MAANTFDQVRVPFQKMTYAPDVPSTALGPNEYNSGQNVETDVRGIRSVAGDYEILDTIPGTPTFVSSGYRRNGEFWFIVATTEGYWWASNGIDDWYNITPGGGPFVGYEQYTNITEAWSGNVPFFNDSLNPPMFLPDEPDAVLVLYSNTLPASISDIVSLAPTYPDRYRLTFKSAITTPYAAGEQIVISQVNNYINGTYTVVGGTVDYVDYEAIPGAAYPGGGIGSVAPLYSWNYNPNWKSYYAGWMRIYNTPNVGSILVAGNLTVTDLNDVVTNFPVTVQWSQAFGLNQAPATWQPTVTNVANQLEVPLRGACVDAFPSNGQLFLSSYWDTVVFSPINYTTTSAPILGVRLFNQGRGMLTSNAWANTDKLVYGIDSRDIWVFDGNDFQGIGNQRVKNWFYDNLHPDHVQQLFMEVNTSRNQVEIYYTSKDVDLTDNPEGSPNKMISYRYDLDCWNPPRDVSAATFACESPIWTAVADSSIPNWINDEGSRTVVYARGIANQQLVQKDYGFQFLTSNANPNGNIASSFRRDNLKLLPNYSGHLLLHRVLPEVVNIGGLPSIVNEEPTYYNLPLIPSPGNVTITVDGNDSTGNVPAQSSSVVLAIATNDPWVQISQNAYRLNSIKVSNTSNTDIWMCNAASFQYTQTQDDR
jgi:hypothetical protein